MTKRKGKAEAIADLSTLRTLTVTKDGKHKWSDTKVTDFADMGGTFTIADSGVGLVKVKKAKVAKMRTVEVTLRFESQAWIRTLRNPLTWVYQLLLARQFVSGRPLAEAHAIAITESSKAATCRVMRVREIRRVPSRKRKVAK